MFSSPIYLILAIGTDIGKTHLVEKLCKKSTKFMAIKPVITGFKADNNSDTARILLSQNQELNNLNLDKISPWRYEKPVSANFVSDIKFDDLIKFCKHSANLAMHTQKTLLIEGAGGVMSPIGKDYNFLDIATELKLPIWLVTANYLGSISHTLCSIEAIKSRNLSLSAIILNDYSYLNADKPVSDAEFIESINNFIDLSIYSLPEFCKIF